MSTFVRRRSSVAPAGSSSSVVLEKTEANKIKTRHPLRRQVTGAAEESKADGEISLDGVLQVLKNLGRLRRSTVRRILYLVFTRGALLLLALWLLGVFSRTDQAAKRAAAYRRTLEKYKNKVATWTQAHPSHTESPGAIADYPFDFCPVYNSHDQVGQLHGKEALSSTRAHIGSSTRTRRFLRKILAGKPVTVSILGGSISSCHGLHGEAAHPLGNPMSPRCYPHRVFDWISQTFPHEQHGLTNGAELKSDTSYFGYCAAWHLPEETDLVIVEFANEDTENESVHRSTEMLIRSILQRPDHPAVIMLGTFSPQIQGEHGFLDAEVYHNAVSRFYDVPHLTVKGLLYHEYLLDPEKVRDTYYIDPILMNEKGHTLLADTVIAYLQSEVCALFDSGYTFGEVDEFQDGMYTETAASDGTDAGALPARLRGGQYQVAGDKAEQDSSRLIERNEMLWRRTGVPPFRMQDNPHSISKYRDVKPYCVSANNLITPLGREYFRTGWTPRAPEHHDKRRSWHASKAGSRLRIPIEVSAGDVFVQYSRRPYSEGFGRVSCWIDDNEAGAIELDGGIDAPEERITVTQIDREVGKGLHFVVCDLLREDDGEERPFKVYGVFCT